MVKIPGLDDLKKMGSDLLDSAKTVNFGEVVEKFKSSIESVGVKKNADVAAGNDPLKDLLQDMSATLTELSAAQAAEASLIKRMQGQLAEIARIANTYQKPTETAAPPVQKEDDKP
jgi:hypothetical protein